MELPNWFFSLCYFSRVVETPASQSKAPAAYYIGGTFDGSRPGKVFVNCSGPDTRYSNAWLNNTIIFRHSVLSWLLDHVKLLNSTFSLIRLKCQLISLALHEANPGHHLQGSYMLAQEGLPDFRKVMEDRNYFQVTIIARNQFELPWGRKWRHGRKEGGSQWFCDSSTKASVIKSVTMGGGGGQKMSKIAWCHLRTNP